MLFGLNFSRSKQSLVITIALGIYFTFIQLLEYVEASFSISDSSFGRTFFVATGFHGLHVLVGTLFLLFTLLRIRIGVLSRKHHFGFEASA
jgi:heme/copper-type cytochrome/quinol oxidase subunit 3